MEDSDDMIRFKKATADYPNYSLYVMEGGTLKTFGGFSKRMSFATEDEAKDYLRQKRSVASRGGRNQVSLRPVLLVRYDAPYVSTMITVL